MKLTDERTFWWNFESSTHVATARKASWIAFAVSALMLLAGGAKMARGDEAGEAGVIFGIAFLLLGIGTRVTALAFQRILALEDNERRS